MDYIFSLFGGVFLSLIFFSTSKIKSGQTFYEKLPYALSLLVNCYITYEVLLTIQIVTVDSGLALSPASAMKFLLGISIVIQMVVILALQVLMIRLSNLIQDQDELLTKVKKVSTIVSYSLVQGTLLLGAFWTWKNVIFV